jgi:hypothetical protein
MSINTAAEAKVLASEIKIPAAEGKVCGAG